MLRRLIVLAFALLPCMATAAPSAHSFSIGVLAFGTVNWELAALRNEGLDRKYGLELRVQRLANPEAGKIGLKAGSIDMIVTDWIWVAQQYQSGADYRFIPYSTHAGALMARDDSSIRGIADLTGKRVGIVGGPLDKNWLMLRALAKKSLNVDFDKMVDKVFGAAPLLNQQLADRKLDALVNFWHYAAKLEAQGYRRVIDGREVLEALGISEPMPNLGYVFKQTWADGHGPTLTAFLHASEEARTRLCDSDATWERILPLIQEKEDKVQLALRREYCEGRVQRWGTEERRAAAKIYTLLREAGGSELTGKAEALPLQIFWPLELQP